MEKLVSKETIKNKAKEYFSNYISIFYATVVIPITYVALSICLIILILINLSNIWVLYWICGLLLITFLKSSIISFVVNRKKELYDELYSEIIKYYTTHSYQIEESIVNEGSKYISSLLYSAIFELNKEIVAKYSKQTTNVIRIASIFKSKKIEDIAMKLDPFYAFSIYYNNMKNDIARISKEILIKK